MLLQVCAWCRVRGELYHGGCPGRIAACTVGWARTAVMDDSVPGVPRVIAQVTGALIIVLQRPFVVWYSPQPRPTPLFCCPCADAFVLWWERGEARAAGRVIPWAPPSPGRDHLKACESIHNPACGERCCLNGFCLWVEIGSDGSLSDCKNSVFLVHYLYHHSLPDCISAALQNVFFQGGLSSPSGGLSQE